VFLMRGELQRAYKLAEQLLRRAESVHDSALLLYARFAIGNTSFWMGEFLPAREHLEIAVTLYDPERHGPLTFRYDGVDARVSCQSYAPLDLWFLGYPDQALQKGYEIVKLAQGLSQPYSLAWSCLIFSNVHQLRDEACAAQETLESLIALCTEHGLTGTLASATSLHGWALAEQGRHEEGIAQIHEDLAALRAPGAGLARPYFLCLLAEAYREAGRLDDGLSALEESLVAADEHENRSYEAETHRLKGELLLKQNNSNTSEVHRCFQRAIEVARKQVAKSWELRATMSLARLLRDAGRREEAFTILSDIYNWFTEGFDTADLKDAKALLDQLGP